jgi:hypothetical protein
METHFSEVPKFRVSKLSSFIDAGLHSAIPSTAVQIGKTSEYFILAPYN